MFKRTPKILNQFGFWQGAASSFDLLGQSFQPNIIVIQHRTDAEALASDWEAIGKDFQVAIAQFQKEKENEVGEPHFR